MVYLDHSATTATDQQVVKKMLPYFSREYGNPSSSHTLGQEAKKALDWARQNLAQFLNCSSKEIIFTSGASESNNLVVKGIKTEHIITTEIEHHSIESPLQELGRDRKVVITYLKPDKNGLISPESLRKAIRPETGLVTIIYANNETGAIQPIREIGKIIEKENKKRRESQIYFHTDAVQAIGYLNCNVKYLHVDMLSLSAHKFYGPKGVGALYLHSPTPLSSLILGGEQELGHRAGTENVPGIVGLGEAIKLVGKEKRAESNRIKELRDYFENKVRNKIPDIKIHSEKAKRLPNISNIAFSNAEGESILLALDLKGIAVSTGSACASNELKPSHVLSAMGIPTREAQSTIRFSFGKDNTKEDADRAVKELVLIIKKLREIGPK